MDYKNVLSWDVSFTLKSVLLLGFLAVFPNVLGLVRWNIAGYPVHLFQILVFTAAFVYGPIGGLLAGSAGSVYTALLINPYVLVGNAILGFFTGVFFKKGLHPVLSCMGAFAVQLPWLWVSDIYWAHMPQVAVQNIVIALLVTNILWAIVAWKAKDSVKKLVG
jgi:hypothetical protein